MTEYTPALAEARAIYALMVQKTRPLTTNTEASAEFDRLIAKVWWNGYDVAEGDREGVPVDTLPGVRTNISGRDYQ